MSMYDNVRGWSYNRKCARVMTCGPISCKIYSWVEPILDGDQYGRTVCHSIALDVVVACMHCGCMKLPRARARFLDMS